MTPLTAVLPTKVASFETNENIQTENGTKSASQSKPELLRLVHSQSLSK